MTRLKAFSLLIACCLASAAAFGDQKDPRLDALFKILQQTDNRQQAQIVQTAIWGIWFEAPSAGTRMLLKQGQDAMSGGDYSSALQNFDALVELEPEFAEAWNRRATLHYLMGNYKASIYDVERTLRLEPRHFGAMSGLGLIYDAMGDEEAALLAFQKALKMNPHMPSVQARVMEIEQTLKSRDI